MGQFFAYRLFQIFKKSILANLKMSKTIFCSSPLNIFKTVYLQISKYLGQFFANPLFKYLKKHTSKCENIWKFFSFSPFQILKKEYLQS